MISSIPAPMPVEDQLREIHLNLRRELVGVERIAIATYDPRSDLLKTYAHSTHGESPLGHHEVRLAEVPSLKAIAESRKDRVVDDLSVFAGSPSAHSRAIATRFGSSYTRPIFESGRLRGFIFFDAADTAYFTPPVVARLLVYSELVAMLLVNSLFPVRMLKSMAYVASELTHTRDPETGAHLDRMAGYSRLVALGIATAHRLSDAFVEHVFAFAPLHDIGKVGIPDSILLKKGHLTEEEVLVMRTHATKGCDIVDRLLGALGIGSLPSVQVLRNIVLHHHEAWDGSGYPAGLAEHRIPIEARIVAVGDVYDALTSERPYKRAWSEDEALAHMERHAGTLFDPDCVRALVAARAEASVIMAAYRDEPGAVIFREGYSLET